MFRAILLLQREEIERNVVKQSGKNQEKTYFYRLFPFLIFYDF